MTLKPEHIVEALNKTPELKRRLILRIMEELLDSEAFMEAYPRLYDPAAAEASPEYRERYAKNWRRSSCGCSTKTKFARTMPKKH